MLGLGLTVYLRVRRHWLSVRVVPRQGEAVQVEGIARIAVRQPNKGNQEVIGIGEEAIAFANLPDVTIHDAFCHPRVLIGGFDEARLVVYEFLRRACGGKKPLLRFGMVIHVAADLEGGLTDVEDRALQELGLRLGASHVTVETEANQKQSVTLADQRTV